MRSVEQQVTRLFLCHMAVGLGLGCVFLALAMIGWDGFVWWRDGIWKALNFFDLASLFPGHRRMIPATSIDVPELRSFSTLLGSVPVEAVALVFGWVVLRRAFKASDETSRRLDLLRRLEAR